MGNKKGDKLEILYGEDKAKRIKEAIRQAKLGDKNPAKRPEVREKIREKAILRYKNGFNPMKGIKNPGFKKIRNEEGFKKRRLEAYNKSEKVKQTYKKNSERMKINNPMKNSKIAKKSGLSRQGKNYVRKNQKKQAICFNLNREELMELYYEQDLSMNKIAKKFSVSGSTIKKRLNKFNITIKPNKVWWSRKGLSNPLVNPKIIKKRVSKSLRNTLPKEEIFDMYINQGMSAKKIGLKFNCSLQTILDILRLNGIRIKKNNEYEVTEKQMKCLEIGWKSMKEKWKNPIFIKKMIRSLHNKPNKPEQILINLIKSNDLPYKYVGSGDFILGGKNPDFIGSDGQKKIIEVFGRQFHDPNNTFLKKIDYKRTEKGTLEHYQNLHYGCLIIWEEELRDMDKVLDKIMLFENGGEKWQ